MGTQDTPQRVVAAVIRRGDRYLVCQRPAHKRHGGLFEFPGGKLREGESLAAAARRELQEELGLVVVSVGEAATAIPDPGSRYIIEFVPTVVTGEPEPTEHTAVVWATLEELAALDLAPSDRRFVTALRQGVE